LLHVCVCRQLERINLSCTSAVKMSLLLLDYLFDRDTQAISNVSGTGKLGKHQLDPLLMYGIQCKTVFSSQGVQFSSLTLLAQCLKNYPVKQKLRESQFLYFPVLCRRQRESGKNSFTLATLHVSNAFQLCESSMLSF